MLLMFVYIVGDFVQWIFSPTVLSEAFRPEGEFVQVGLCPGFGLKKPATLVGTGGTNVKENTFIMILMQ